MELITARKGTPHITPMQDAMWHMGLTELESCVFDAFENFKADIITANEIRVRSGVGMIQGRFFEIPQNTYDPATIMNGTQGEKRIDLIVCRVTVNESENTQKAETVVIQGTPTAGTPQAPAPITGDLDNGDTVADYPLYAVNISGITITSVTPQFETGWMVSAETVQMFADAGYPITGGAKTDRALRQLLAMAAPDMIQLKMAADHSIAGSTAAKMNFNVIDIKKGSRLSDSNGAVLVGSGVKRVRVSSNLLPSSMNSSKNGLYMCHLYHNGAAVCAAAGITWGGCQSSPNISGLVLDVTEGDTIDLRTNTAISGEAVVKIYKNYSYFTVEVVE